MLFLHWFYKVVREQCCFFIGFRRVVREKREKTCAKTRFFVDNPPGMVSPAKPKPKQSTPVCLTTALASQSNRLSLAHTASPRLARSHARTKRNDFPVGGFTKGLTPPTFNVLVLYYIEKNVSKQKRTQKKRPPKSPQIPPKYTQNAPKTPPKFPRSYPKRPQNVPKNDVFFSMQYCRKCSGCLENYSFAPREF